MKIDREIRIADAGVVLEGRLIVPERAHGLVLFAHGSGSSRFSPRNQFVAHEIRRGGRIATLLFDLLTREEESLDAHTGHWRFDIKLLAERLILATEWVMAEASTRALHLGYFGSSTGAAAALVAAAQQPRLIGAIVSRGGRPDLAGPLLDYVRAPTLLIVGGDDDSVIELNQLALQQMCADVRLEVVPEATHLFEEPGALERVAQLARDWFERYLTETFVGQEAGKHVL
jgi:pimeloyl-ACP methyl ester carboxylesterase